MMGGDGERKERRLGWMATAKLCVFQAGLGLSICRHSDA